jgi:hypothetical protein
MEQKEEQNKSKNNTDENVPRRVRGFNKILEKFDNFGGGIIKYRAVELEEKKAVMKTKIEKQHLSPSGCKQTIR